MGDSRAITAGQAVGACEDPAELPSLTRHFIVLATSEPEETTDNSDATDASESDSTTEDTADAATEESPEETA